MLHTRRPRSKERSSSTSLWHHCCQPPRWECYFHSPSKELLVARHENLCKILYRWMYSLSTDEAQHSSNLTSHQFYTSGEYSLIQDTNHGFHHRPTTIQWLRLYIGCHWSWLFKRCSTNRIPQNYWCNRNYRTSPLVYLQAIRSSLKDYLWSRATICFPSNERSRQNTWYSNISHHSVSPPDR